MKKIGKILIALSICFIFVWVGQLLADRAKLSQDIIRLHVVGASDTSSDQALKLKVRDAVLTCLEQEMDNAKDMSQAQQALEQLLPSLTQTANAVLAQAGVEDRAKVTLGEEGFPTRHYDTFSLPAGVYSSLRVTIGQGEGKNWWCVVFPGLCIPATSEGFSDTAVGAGFSDTLTDTLEQEQGYEVRFFLLDCLGRIQSWFFRG